MVVRRRIVREPRSDSGYNVGPTGSGDDTETAAENLLVVIGGDHQLVRVGLWR